MKFKLALILPFILWFVMFSPWTAPYLNFWWAMTVSACLLLTISLPSYTFSRQQITLGNIISALIKGAAIAFVLWWVFWVGDRLSSLLFDFARPQVDSIYHMKDDTQPWLIALLLLLIIGPAEELFWRGYVQRRLTEQWNADKAFFVTVLLYTLVHLPSFNFMLIMSAMTCGICWGLLYRLFPRQLPAIVISHAIWDAAVFVWFPI